MHEAKLQEARNREAKRKPADRARTYVLFVDLRKAYDSVDRDLLIAKLLKETSIPSKYVVWMAKLLKISNVTVAGETYDTYKGCPQGSVLSPSEYNQFSNDLVKQLNLKHKTLAYADDLVLVCKSRIELLKAISELKKWCRANGIEINYQKSAVLIVKVDRRTRENDKVIQGFPV